MQTPEEYVKNLKIEFYRTDEKSLIEPPGEYKYLKIEIFKEEQQRRAVCELCDPFEVRYEIGRDNLEHIPHIKDAPIIDKLLYVLYMEGSGEAWSTFLDDEVVEEILEVCKEELERRNQLKKE